MDFNSFKEAVLARCKEKGLTDYELYYETCQSTSVSVFRQEVDRFTGSTEGGVCFRTLIGDRMGYASTEELTAQEAVRIVDAAADNAATLESEDPGFLGEGGQTYEAPDRDLYPLPTTAELIDTALDAQKRLYAADPSVSDGSTTQTLMERTELKIWNSKGLDLSYVNQIAGLVTVAVVAEGAQRANAAKIALGQLDRIDRDGVVAEAVRKALGKLGGDPAPTGTCPVVFSPKAMAALLQTYSGIFSARRAQKGLSKLADREGDKIAAECVTIVDDPFHPDSPCPVPFDAEGSPTCRKVMVSGGTLTTLLYDLQTAHKAGRHTTGNAAKGSYKSPVGIRPFSMYLADGPHTAEELLEKAGDGVYIDSVTGLHAGANAVSGDFSLQSEGFLIREGRLTDHVKSFTVAGNFYDLLKDITALANDSSLQDPLGPTAFGAPTTLVKALSIAGK